MALGWLFGVWTIRRIEKEWRVKQNEAEDGKVHKKEPTNVLLSVLRFRLFHLRPIGRHYSALSRGQYDHTCF